MLDRGAKIQQRQARRAANSRRHRRRLKAGIVVLRITARLDRAEALVRRCGYLLGTEATLEDIEQALTDLVDDEGA
jgi:hypothetical protein